MALESNFDLGTIDAMLNTITSGWWKVLTLLPKTFGEIVTNPNNKVQYAHNHKFELFLYMQKGFTHTSFGVGIIQPLVIKLINCLSLLGERRHFQSTNFPWRSHHTA